MCQNLINIKLVSLVTYNLHSSLRQKTVQCCSKWYWTLTAHISKCKNTVAATRSSGVARRLWQILRCYTQQYSQCYTPNTAPFSFCKGNLSGFLSEDGWITESITVWSTSTLKVCSLHALFLHL